MYNVSYKDVINLARQIIKDACALKKPDTSHVNMRKGFESSLNACKQEEKVYYAPLVKNALAAHGESLELLVNTPVTKTEEDFLAHERRLLIKQFGSAELKEYAISQPLDSICHYGVDCCHNAKPNMRQIQPGQYDERKEISLEFGKQMDPEPIFDLIEGDKLMQLAITRVLEMLPTVVADTDFTETSAPFETKHTNVGYEWWFNDRVKSESGETYGEISLNVAKKQTYSSLDQYNICTAFGRNQRGKGRLLIAMSRVVNLWLNRLEAREIELYKSVPYFVGYGDDHDLKQAMIRMLGYANVNDLVAYNWDQSGFDRHINPALLALVGAISEVLAKNALGKRIAHKRACYNLHSWLVNGMTGEVEEIFGRMFSGFIDTNRGDGLVECIAFTWALMHLDQKWTYKVARTKHFMFGMGDDLLALIDPKTYDPDELSSLMGKLGFELNTEKSAFGIFFLQYRLFRYNDDLVMVYPWTRVLRSMLFLEQPRGLGPYGWLMSQYQQLSKLVEYPPALDAVVEILLPYDKLKFGANDSVDSIIEHIKQEDQQAKAESKGTQFRTTAEKLFDGDPTKQRQFTESGEINSSWLGDIHQAVCASVARVSGAPASAKAA